MLQLCVGWIFQPPSLLPSPSRCVCVCLSLVCGYPASELCCGGVGIWCCGNFSMGIIGGAKRLPVQTWRARRRRGDTAASWVTFEERDQSEPVGGCCLFLFFWTGSCRWKNCSHAFFFSNCPFVSSVISSCGEKKKRERLSVFPTPPHPHPPSASVRYLPVTLSL